MAKHDEASLNAIFALLSWLNHENTFYPLADLSRMFGIPVEKIKDVIADVCSLDEYHQRCIVDDFLVNAFDDSSPQFSQPLALTRDETLALYTVLDAAGFKDTEILNKLWDASKIDPNDVGTYLLQEESGNSDGEKAKFLFARINRSQVVQFDYRKENERKYQKGRKVEPLLLFTSNGYWYLRAFDLDKNSERTFRLDRMKSLQKCPEHCKHSLSDDFEGGQPSFVGSERVKIAFDKDYKFLPGEWPQARAIKTQEDDDASVYSVPHLRTPWLARQILATAGAARVVDNDALAAEVASLAKETLSEYEQIW